MKKILLTFVLLIGIVAGLFAQKLTYQAVIRDNNQQLVVNTAVKATVTITFTSGDPYQAEVNGTTNLHGLLSIEFGDATLNGRDWTNATIAVKVVNAATSSIVYVYEAPRPVSAVPYALSVNGMAIQQYLTEHHYVTEMQVGVQIHDSISNIAAKSHTHDNKALLDTYTQTNVDLADAVNKKHSHENMSILNATTAPYTDADSAKLDGIEAGAQKNVKSDWKQTDNAKDDYIKNKPSITDTVNNILTMGKYVTETTLDGRRYLTSDSAVIIKMRSDIDTNKTKISTNATNIETNKENISTNTTNIDNLILHTTKNAIRDSVAGQIHDSISNIAVTFHTHDNMSILNETTASFTEEDSEKLDGIEDGAEVNVQSDWDEDDSTEDAYILNKPTNVSAFTNDAGYLTQAHLMGLRDTMNAMQNKIDSLSRKLDSLINFIFDIPITFICGISTVKDIDNNEYGTVKIGNQCWMKENLRTTTGVTVGTNCWHANNSAGNDTTYGLLYSWAAVMKGAGSTNYPASGSKVRGICPTGWHVPSDAEWNTLTDYVNSVADYKCGGTDQAIANALSAATGWNNSSISGCNAGNYSTTRNLTGFSAVPAGSCADGSFGAFGVSAYFWSATQGDGPVAWCRLLASNASHVSSGYGHEGLGYSVRCLKDN